MLLDIMKLGPMENDRWSVRLEYTQEHIFVYH